MQETSNFITFIAPLFKAVFGCMIVGAFLYWIGDLISKEQIDEL